MKKSRRDFIKSAGRATILAAFGGVGAYAVRGKKISAKAEANCSVNSLCKKCAKFAGCQKVQNPLNNNF